MEVHKLDRLACHPAYRLLIRRTATKSLREFAALVFYLGFELDGDVKASDLPPRRDRSAKKRACLHAPGRELRHARKPNLVNSPGRVTSGPVPVDEASLAAELSPRIDEVIRGLADGREPETLELRQDALLAVAEDSTRGARERTMAPVAWQIAFEAWDRRRHSSNNR